MSKFGIKLSIRTNEEEGMIVAYFSDMEEKHMLPVSCFAIEIARSNKACFESWVEGMQGVLTVFLKTELGLTPAGFFRFNKADRQ